MAGAMFVPPVTGQEATTSDDPWQWLEDVTGDKALDWVRARNKVSQAALETDPSFAKLKSDLLAILDSDARIPMVSKRGEFLYNFWRDKQNPRGLWRRTTLDEYVKAEPKWEVLLDLDALGTAENENWVWGGGQLLRPDYKRAMISLPAVERTRRCIGSSTSRNENSWKGASTCPRPREVSAGSMLTTCSSRLISVPAR